MRNFVRSSFFLLFLIPFCNLYAQEIDKRTYSALDDIKKGYIQYGVEMFKKISATNGIGAQYYMAVCYEYGIVVEKDLTSAFRWYRKAAERGLPDAMLHIASFYKDGKVVMQDESRYNQWMQRYEKKGGKCILPDLVTIYNEGIKFPKNYAFNPNGEYIGAVSGDVTKTSSDNKTVNNITIVQQAPVPITPNPTPNNPIKAISAQTPKSDVDVNIPVGKQKNENTFAWIFANENYQNVAQVPNAINDGSVFAEYCEKTLGLPKTNIHFVKDATYNNMRREMNLLKQIAEAYNESSKIIIYYAGHGLPDEATKAAYLLPIDGYCQDMATCYSLKDMYSALGAIPSSQVIILLDACFSGSQRDDKMLTSARSVVIKSKPATPSGKMIVLSAAQGDETAYSYADQRHGLFTYYLLKKLKESKGDVTLGDLYSYIKDNVVRKSLVINSKRQTPSVSSSSSLSKGWQKLKLK